MAAVKRGGARNPVGVRDGRATVTGMRSVPGVRNSSAASPSSPGRQIPWRFRDRAVAGSAAGSQPVRRLLLVRHAPTSATRAAAFPADEPLDERGRRRRRARSPRACRGLATSLCSPALRCRADGRGGGPADAAVEPALAECDFGAWAGRTLAELARDRSRGGGRVDDRPRRRARTAASRSPRSRRGSRGWLDGQARLDGRAVAITHGGVVKAAVVHALGAPLAAFWRVDCAPLSITELHAHDGRWTVTSTSTCAIRASARRNRAAGAEVSA